MVNMSESAKRSSPVSTELSSGKTEDADFPENVGNVQTFTSVYFTWFFYRYSILYKTKYFFASNLNYS